MRPGGQLQRSLAALTIGVHQGGEDRKKALADTLTGEWDQLVHVNLSGAATSVPSSIDDFVQWEMPFLCPRPTQHRAAFPTPHFGQSIEITAGQGTLVRIHATVIGWTVTESQWFVGAQVRFDADAPLASTPQPFSAIAHLTFTGYATMAEMEEFA